MTPPLPTPDILTVYGADWCADCLYARRILDEAGARYRYVDLRVDREAQEHLAAAGILAIPVVVTTDGQILIDPSRRELESAAGIAQG
ncbi:MAG: NrdH-redoxin [Chloroflexi bacterium]|nr:NrdH-redoxin [Chloroflexota bacterium]